MNNDLKTFAELNLSSALMAALDDLKFESPSPIQSQTIPWLLAGRDLIGLAQTGTGKTAAFGLPILENLSPNVRTPQALILTPTRELAIQVAAHIETLASKMPDISVAVLCGGHDYQPQLKKLKAGAHIVVGTPGRILDHLEKGTLDLRSLMTFVLDEADEMLRMGFIEDVEVVLAKLPAKRQIALFSATMPARIRQIGSRYLNDPISVEIRMETATVKSIEQRFIFVSQPQKTDALLRILMVEEHQGVIVFVRTKSSTEDIATVLQQQGIRAMAIHGDITQVLRERVISQFKQGSIDVLVATDVAARGLDVERVTHVINYDMAHDCETYVHRIGRTGRAGRSGITILFVTPRESKMLSIIERHTRQRIEKMVVPNDPMIQEAKEQNLIKAISSRVSHQHLAPYQRIIDKFLQANPEVSATDLASILALMHHQDKPWQSQMPAFKAEVPFKDKENRQRSKTSISVVSSRDFGERRPRAPMRGEFSAQEIFRMDVGRVHGVKPGNIVGAIANEAGIQSRFITGLKIHDDYSTVRLPKGMGKDVITALNKAWVCGRQLKLTAIESN